TEPGKTIQIYDFDTNQKIDYKNPENEKYKYLHINISQADSNSVLEEFIPVFQLLIGYYRDNSIRIKQYYDNFVQELYISDNLIIDKKKKIPQGQESKLSNRKFTATHKKLYDRAPDIFVPGYPRVCQSGLQPEPVDNIEEWQALHPLSDGNKRQV